MSDSVVEAWLRSGKYANVDGELLRPREHPQLKGSPILVVRGQARVYYLESSNGQHRVLKKFVPNMRPDHTYISSIRALVPHKPGFESGFLRKVLLQSSLATFSKNGVYDSPNLAAWLQDTVLMPHIQGRGWSLVIDDIRSKILHLTAEQRIRLCKRLIKRVMYLEDAQISHRDLSSQNVLIDKSWDVYLIDWDCLYHPSLVMPSNTTYGANGYIAPFVKQDVSKTWCERADRFSLAILIAEFLTAAPAAPLGGDGGIFNQDELDARGGGSVKKVLSELDKQSPATKMLFQQALYASTFNQMPSGKDWEKALSGGVIVDPPKKTSVHLPQRVAELLAIGLGAVLGSMARDTNFLPFPLFVLILFGAPLIGFASSKLFSSRWGLKMLLYYIIFHGVSFSCYYLGYQKVSDFAFHANFWTGLLLAGVNSVYGALKWLGIEDG